jgi:hypothetical protein
MFRDLLEAYEIIIKENYKALFKNKIVLFLFISGPPISEIFWRPIIYQNNIESNTSSMYIYNNDVGKKFLK